MASSHEMFLLLTLFVVFFTGLILNACILIVNFMEWRKGTRLQPCDQIHVSMGLVNILLQCAMTFTWLVLWFPDQYIKDVITLLSALMMFLIYLSLWLNAWLGIYFVTTFSNFNHRLFVCLKSNISTIFTKIILVSAVGCFVVSLPSIWKANLQIHQETIGNSTINSTYITKRRRVNQVYLLTAISVGCYLPFILSNLCIGHILTSLLKHIWRVTHNDSGLTHPNLQAHIRAVTTMILLLCLCLSFYLAQTFRFFSSGSVDDVISQLSFYLTLAFPTAESIILIQASFKLRKLFSWRCYAGNR
ncbi:taste receptor type 2 member 9-like [Pelodytes ibericus]